jgi:hypothetical protein
MTPEEFQRFDMLRQGPCASSAYVWDYYGLHWPFGGDLISDYDLWRTELKRKNGCVDGTVSRHELEAFLQRKQVLPTKWMAARLGMRASELDSLLGRLPEIGLRPPRYIVYPELISEALADDLVANLPGLRFRTFSDHESFCLRLHEELRQRLGIAIEPLFCATSERIQEYPRRFAKHFDCITLAPLSVKHQLWLSFHKPLLLGPDRCSKLFYVENHEALRPYCAPDREPEELEAYQQFLAGQVHG